MRVLNPWTQRLLTAKLRGKPPFIPHPAVFSTVSGGMERSRGKPPVPSSSVILPREWRMIGQEAEPPVVIPHDSHHTS